MQVGTAISATLINTVNNYIVAFSQAPAWWPLRYQLDDKICASFPCDPTDCILPAGCVLQNICHVVAMSVPAATAALRATSAPGARDIVITAPRSAAGRDVNAINQSSQQLDLHHDIEQGIVAPQPELNSPLSHGMAGSTHDAAHLYDAVGAIWLQLFGSHVHVGEGGSLR